MRFGIGCRVLLLVAAVLLVNFHLAIRQGEFAAPISVTLEGRSDTDLAEARLTAYYLGSDAVIAPTRLGFWECPARCTVDVVLQFPEPLKSSDGIVRIDIGDRTFTLPLSELEAHGRAYWLPDTVNYGPTPSYALCRNWPGREVFVHYYLARTAPGVATVLLLTLAVALGMCGPFRMRFSSTMGFTEVSTIAVASPGGYWNLTGWGFLIGGFIFLQWLEPYYFTQDDALVGELPGILLGCRSLWQGIFPDWNPYVFLGAPLATVGFWAITYPPQLISYAIARHILGNEFATMEVFAALHLLAGFLAMRHLCRRIGMEAMTANVAALSFVFAGCILIMGRSWHAFIANTVWLPLLGIAIQRFREGPVGWKWITGVGVVLGLSYHAGFPQIVAILGMFLVVGLTSVLFAQQLPLRRLAPVVPALLLGVGLAAPLLLHHLQMTGGHERFVPAEHGAYDNLHGALLPYPLAEAGFPTPWGSSHVEKMGQFFFFGGVFAALFALQAIAFWILFPDRQAWARAWWVPCGIFALLMVLGEPAYLWKGISAVPMSKFFLRYSFRFYPWLAFCAILSGGLILDRVLATLRRRQTAELLAGAALLGILAWHLAMCRPSFYNYGFQPYPPLPEEFESAFHPYSDKTSVGDRNSRRIASWSQLRSPSPGLYASLPLNLPHYYQVPSLFGYDPVVEGQARVKEVYRRLEENPVATCKAYGVGWHLFADEWVYSPNKRFHSMEQAVPFEQAYRKLCKADLTPLTTQEGTTLKELPGVDPLAFVTGRPEQVLPLHLHCRGGDIDVAGLPAGTRVTANFLYYPPMALYLDGQRIAIEPDDWQRITTTLPQAGSTLSLRFEPPWGLTCGIGAALCLAAWLLGWAAQRLRGMSMCRLGSRT